MGEEPSGRVFSYGRCFVSPLAANRRTPQPDTLDIDNLREIGCQQDSSQHRVIDTTVDLTRK